MTTALTRRRWLGGLVGALLAGMGLRPGGGAAAACPHPLHDLLRADRPGTAGCWWETPLRLVCPRCGWELPRRGFLAEAPCTLSDPVPPPQLADRSYSLGSWRDESGAPEASHVRGENAPGTFQSRPV